MCSRCKHAFCLHCRHGWHGVAPCLPKDLARIVHQFRTGTAEERAALIAK